MGLSRTEIMAALGIDFEKAIKAKPHYLHGKIRILGICDLQRGGDFRQIETGSMLFLAQPYRRRVVRQPTEG